MANTFCSLNHPLHLYYKERVAILSPEIRERLWPFLGGIAKQNGIIPRCIGGVADQVHLLLSFPTTITVAKAIQLIKGGSPSWLHQTFPKLGNNGAFAVSVSHLPDTINYIQHRPNITAREPSERST
jgi:REP element-mobilizing transposase RayT